jgi:hypothetical protein
MRIMMPAMTAITGCGDIMICMLYGLLPMCFSKSIQSYDYKNHNHPVANGLPIADKSRSFNLSFSNNGLGQKKREAKTVKGFGRPPYLVEHRQVEGYV